ncbi:hypothetical protein GWI33_013993 [Rhynchophorus ferrugineus]|uniref:Uncharacterized protein n=1 Tax=Rhynchophorus ferrugineus TaxID=354439 RepID=A0A834I851_RHYFE|nr:hypothetical protein GWI33_013993 [Rhynchophorus ferrugineus]
MAKTDASLMVRIFGTSQRSRFIADIDGQIQLHVVVSSARPIPYGNLERQREGKRMRAREEEWENSNGKNEAKIVAECATAATERESNYMQQ